MKYGLKEEQLAEIIEKIQKFPAIEKAMIYGSRATGEYKPASDVDIAIFGENADSNVAMSLKDELEEETYLPYFFDVLPYDHCPNQDIKARITQEGKIIYQKCKGEPACSTKKTINASPKI